MKGIDFLRTMLTLRKPWVGYYALMKLRISEGRASFDSEKQNEPVNPVWVQKSAQAEVVMRQELQGGVNFISAAHRMPPDSGHRQPAAGKSHLLTQRDLRLG